MSKGPVVFLGIGALWGFGLGCQSEGKIPFEDDALGPGNSAGQASNAGSSGRGGSSGASGRGGAAPIATGGTGGTGGGGTGGSSGTGSFGRGGTGSSNDPRVVGESCAVNATCRAIRDGYCANAGFCTAECTTHVDCGCPPGTVNDDIAAGDCSAACVTYDNGSFCQRVCDSSAACDGDTRCQELDFYGVCSPG